MNLVLLVVAAAVMTYLSRAASLVFLPAPRDRLATLVARVPAPLFAGLAVATLLDDGGAVPAVPALAAAGAAVLVAPRRSLGLTLVAGLAAYAAAAMVV